MKKYFLIALVTVTSLTFTNCGSDDDDSSTDQQTLTGGVWKFTKYTIDTVDKTDTLDECNLLETFSFTDDGKFVNKHHEKSASSGQCELNTTLSGTWKEIETMKYALVFDNNADDPITFVLGRFDLAYGREEDSPTGKTSYRYEFRKQ